MGDNEAYLCAIRALADWLHASKITHGYLFRKIASGDRISKDNIPMVLLLFCIIFTSINT